MSVTKEDIITLPNPHLRKHSARIGVITPEIRQLVEDMKNATISWDTSREHEFGVALAAVQIDKLIRLVVIRNNFEDKKDNSFSVFVNPEIAKLEGEVVADYEGCLSVPDIYGFVPRNTKVRVKALDLDGKPFRVTAEGFLARIFQHEIDHTKGIVFIDHIKEKHDAFFRLNEEGKLTPMDYRDVKANHLLWE